VEGTVSTLDPRGYPISAHSAACALGMTYTEAIEALYAGRGGLRAGAFDVPFETASGALPDALPRLPERLRAYDTRLARMAWHLLAPLQAAVTRASKHYGAARIGIVVATSTAGLATTEEVYGARRAHGALPSGYSFERTHAFAALLEVLRAGTGCTGPGYVLSTACSSGNKVFGSAQRLLAAGSVDAVLVGGIDTLCQTTLRGFHELGILSASACRPFAAGRDGTSIGEGGALFLIERAGEGALRLCGVGETSDAHHMTQPLADGSGARAAMQAALAQAQRAPSEIAFISAHGTGTPLNDASEAQAIASLFDRTPVLATKGYTGHMLGAAASIEAAFVLASFERAQLPLSLHSTPLDPALPVNVTERCERARGGYAISNAFAFGGSNAAVVFGGAA
jgi:3-oxoacyl-[acyl-carrier-protein] synthase-1